MSLEQKTLSAIKEIPKEELIKEILGEADLTDPFEALKAHFNKRLLDAINEMHDKGIEAVQHVAIANYRDRELESIRGLDVNRSSILEKYSYE